MTKSVLCKFFIKGECLKGDCCEFLHDWRGQANKVCTFYQRGACSYGSRCRYEHVNASQPHTSLSSANSSQDFFSEFVEVDHLSITAHSAKGNPSLGAPVELSAQSRPFSPPGFLKCNKDSHAQENSNNENVVIAEQPICVFAAAGNCPHGESCPHLHGKLCPTCEKYVLHPYRQNEREEHIRTCERKRKDLETFKLSQEIECSVCLERVLSKPMAAERKFGLLSECDHPFCISCIRSWRSNSPTSGMDVNTALRACPICRKLSYFVIPSAIWYSRQEEKQQIVHNYKAKLRSIDCKHFDYGNGSCPFGTSCFYKHTYQPHRYGHRQHSYGSSGILSDGEEEVDDLDEFAPDIYDWEDFIIQEELEDLNDDDIDTEDDIEEAFLLMQLLALDVSSADEN